METRKIIHIDMDSFYASVEQKDNPQYKGKPVIVGGINGRGVVATASYEARKFGIHSAMPISRAKRLCPDGIYLLPRFQRYKEISEYIKNIFKRYTGVIEPLSLDEAYLDVTENYIREISATRIAEQIRSEIFKETGLTASAGVSFNKFFAKIASELNKPDGISVLTPVNWQKTIYQLPVAKFHGIGNVTAEKLHKFGIQNGYDIFLQPPDVLLRLLGKNGLYYYNVVRGVDNRLVNSTRKRKSVGAENTFDIDLQMIDDLLVELESVVMVLCGRLANGEYSGRTVSLKVKYDNFQTITRSASFQDCISETEKIFEIAKDLLLDTIDGKRKIRLIGVTISNLCRNDPGLFK